MASAARRRTEAAPLTSYHQSDGISIMIEAPANAATLATPKLSGDRERYCWEGARVSTDIGISFAGFDPLRMLPPADAADPSKIGPPSEEVLGSENGSGEEEFWYNSVEWYIC